jgi:hypothetical protein
MPVSIEAIGGAMPATHIVAYGMEGGGAIRVETPLPENAVSVESFGDAALPNIDDVLGEIEKAGKKFVALLQRIEPKSGSVEFGVTLTGEAGFIIAHGSAEANLTVTLNWGSS